MRGRGGLAPRGADGVVRRTVKLTASSLVRARLGAARGDWDLGIFDRRTRRSIGGSAGFGARELAEGFAAPGDVVVQACRRTGRARSARLRVAALPLPKPRASRPRQQTMLVSVRTPTRAAKARLQALGLDLTEHGDAGSLDVVLHGVGDEARLRNAGLDYEIEIADLLAHQARNRLRDARHALRVQRSSLFSRRDDYRRLPDFEADTASWGPTWRGSSTRPAATRAASPRSCSTRRAATSPTGGATAASRRTSRPRRASAPTAPTARGQQLDVGSVCGSAAAGRKTASGRLVARSPQRRGMRLTLSTRRIRLGALRRRGLLVNVRCSSRCATTVALRVANATARRYGLTRRRRGSITVARVRVRGMRADRMRPARLRLTRTASRRLRRASRVAFTMTATAQSATGERRAATLRFTLRR